MKSKLLSNARALSLGLVLMLAGAEAGEAQGLHLGFGKRTSHGVFGVSLSLPVRSSAYAAEPRRVWVPGRYETVEQRVWVEGVERREWVPARYETRHDECGRPTSVLVRQGYWTMVCDPGHFEARAVRVWVEGYWRAEPVAYAGARYRGHGRGCDGG